MSDLDVTIELQRLLDGMDVPKLRRWDLAWLRRNLAVRNGDHPDFARVMELVKRLEV